MKNRLSLIIASALLTFGVFAPQFAHADEGTSNSSQGMMEYVDLYGDYSGNVSTFSEKLAEAVGKTKDDTALENIVGALDSAGLEGGWAKQIGSLKKISGVFSVFSDAIDLINKADTAKQLGEAFAENDKARFSEIVADAITDFAAGKISDLVGKLIYRTGAKWVIASSAGGPVTMLVSAAGVFVLGWVGSYAAEKGVEWIMNTETVRKVLIGIGNTIWDWLKGSESNNGNGQVCYPGQDPGNQGGPFDGQPESGSSNGKNEPSGRYQGLKPIKLF